MRRTTLPWLILAIATVCVGTAPAFAQESSPRILFGAFPPHGENLVAPRPAAGGAAAATTLPMWNFTTTASRDGHDYHGTMIGRSPFFHGARTTGIDVVLIPLRISIRNANRFTEAFDPTQTDGCLPSVPNETATALSLTQESPVLMQANVAMNGVDESGMQYVDAFRRANFFSLVNTTGDRYHTVLNVTKVAALSPVTTQTFNDPQGAIVKSNCASKDIGVIDFFSFDSKIQSSILPALVAKGVVTSTVLPVFLLYNVVMTTDLPNQQNPLGFNCCTLGYHSGKGSLPNVQFYAVADFYSGGTFGGASNSPIDVYVLSHEIAELLDDPLVQNAGSGAGLGTPAWGHVGQDAQDCQTWLEVADPLSSAISPRFFLPPLPMPNGVTYHPAELAFFSWFYGAPSIGAGGSFSNDGTFTTDAGAICSP